MKMKKSTIIAGTTVLAAGAAYFGTGLFFYDQLLSRRTAGGGMNALVDAELLAGKPEPKEIGLMQRFMEWALGGSPDYYYDLPFFPLFQEGVKWFFDRKPEKVVTQSPRGERLHAELIKNEKPSDVWAISIHGFTSCPRDMGGCAMMFDQWGYNTLLPHLCGHNDSESKHVAMGWHDRVDILAWIGYLNREYNNPKIILHGISMGGATVMMTTGEDLPPNVVCAIEDCGYTSVWDEYAHQLKQTLHLPAFPAVYAMDTVTRLRSGFELKEASCVEQVKKSKTPTLFIHGEDDDFVPFWMLDKVYEAAACEKEKLAVPGAKHAESGYQTELYYGTMKKFIDKYMPEENAA